MTSTESPGKIVKCGCLSNSLAAASCDSARPTVYALIRLPEAAYSRRRVHIMAMPRSSGSDTRRSRAGGAEILHRGDNGGAGERAPLRRSQFEFFLPVNDGSGLEQHRRHGGLAQDDKLIIAIHAGLGVDQDAAAMAH